MKFNYNNKIFSFDLKSKKINPLNKIYSKIDFNSGIYKSIKSNNYIKNIKGDLEFNEFNFLNKVNINLDCKEN